MTRESHRESKSRVQKALDPVASATLEDARFNKTGLLMKAEAKRQGHYGQCTHYY